MTEDGVNDLAENRGAADPADERSLSGDETWGQGPDSSHPESATGQPVPALTDETARTGGGTYDSDVEETALPG